MEKFLIIDGNSIMNRAFYGIRLLTNAEGLYTNAVYGFLNILIKNLEEIKPDYICVAFDLKAPTFRHKKYELYKAQRKGMPDELAVQMPVIKEVLSAMNIAILEKEGYEADDIIGTIARMCDEKAIECDILTGDKDDLQLASETTKVYLTVTSKGKTTTDIYDSCAVFEKYGVTPKEFIDVKGLMGDASDNIPGVKGIGEKTAFSLISQFKSIDSLYENLDKAKIGPSARTKLEEGKDMAYLSKELATIDTFVPLSLTLSDCHKKDYDASRLLPLFTRLGFKAFIESLKLNEASEKSQSIKINAEEIKNDDELKTFTEKLEKFYYLIIKNKLGEYKGLCFLAFDKPYYTRLPLSSFKSIFENESIEKISHGIKEDIILLSQFGIGYENYSFDTKIGAYLLDPTSSGYSISRLALAYLKKIVPEEEDFKGENSFFDEENFDALFSSFLYSLRDLSSYILDEIKKNSMESLLYDIELPLIRVLANLTLDGIFVDTENLKRYGEKLTKKINTLSDNIIFMAGEDFNINSPKQLGTVLFEHMGIPPVKKTKSGYSTDADVLLSLSGKYEIVDLILEYRTLSKLKGTYVDGLLPMVLKDGKIHTSFNQTVTATGRISSTEPNLQNIPVRTDEGREMRKMFTAENEGRILVDADYSQIELRVLAHMSNDENMINSFLEGRDIHTKTASEVFSVPESAVTESMRRHAKAVNFGIVYGISEFGLAKDLGISRFEAKKYIEAYFNTYPSIKKFLDNTISNAKETGFVKTMYGRKRFIPEILSNNFNQRSFGERVAMNTPIQGSAADIIKIAMIRVFDALKKEAKDSKLLLQVHDELIVSCPIDEKDNVMKILKREMENATSLKVPLTTDISCGYSWYDAK